jgi:hypothetical protein
MKKLILLLFAPALLSFAQEIPYGLDRGSVGVVVDGGMQIKNGAHPTLNGTVDFGLLKYFGLYAESGYTLAYNAQLGEYYGGGGVEVTGNNRSRIIPFARAGMDYGRMTAFGYGGTNVPAVHVAGGMDAYVTRHFGLEAKFGLLHGWKNGLSSSLPDVTFGVFYRSK